MDNITTTFYLEGNRSDIIKNKESNFYLNKMFTETITFKGFNWEKKLVDYYVESLDKFMMKIIFIFVTLFYLIGIIFYTYFYIKKNILSENKEKGYF
jgi:hypothetical protein